MSEHTCHKSGYEGHRCKGCEEENRPKKPLKLTQLEQRMMDKLKGGPVYAYQLRSWEKVSMVRLTRKIGVSGIPLVLEKIVDPVHAPAMPLREAYSSKGLDQRRAWVANNGSFVFREGKWHKVPRDIGDLTSADAKRLFELGFRIPSLRWWYTTHSKLGCSPRQAVDAGRWVEVEALPELPAK